MNDSPEVLDELYGLRHVAEIAREIRDQYLPKDGIELQTFEALWGKLNDALEALATNASP